MAYFPTTIPALFRHFLGRHSAAFALIFAAPLAMALESSVMPYALRVILDTLSGHSGDRSGIFAEVSVPLMLYGGAWLLMIVIFRLQEWVASRAIPRLQAEVREAAFAYVQGHSHRFFADHFAGSMANKLSDLPRAMTSLITLTCWRLLTAFSVATVVTIMVGMIHPWFAIILVVWTLIHVGTGILFARRIDALSTENAEMKSGLQGLIVDSFSNQLAVRLFARGHGERAVLRHAQAAERQSHQCMLLAMWKVKLVTELPTLGMVMGMLVLLVYGWREGWVSPGELVFVVYGSMNVMVFVWMFTVEMPQFFSEIGVLRQALELVQAPHEIVDAPEAVPLQMKGGEIIFEDVAFGYREDRGVFNGLSLRIAPGERVGLVGFSGSGKTTFINLLLRLYELKGGRILIDGQDIAKVTQDSLHDAIAVIPQDTSLFHRSLRDNICYGRPDASEEEMLAAASKAQCHDFVMGLQQGYETEVGERGVKLSGGQRQRIALARAILKNAPILVMDEATSALDSVTERVIQESMEQLMQGRTALVIAHRLSTLSRLDRILVFDQGQLIEEGTHERLLAAQGHYARMWHMQAGGFLPEVRVG